MKFKMYVWNKVLKDYGYGMIVIHARGIKEAREIAMKNKLSNEIQMTKPDLTFYGKGLVSLNGSG